MRPPSTTPERRPDQEIVDVLAGDEVGRPVGEHQAIAPADHQPDDIGERIPADRERPQRDRDRVDRRKGDDEKRHRRGL